MVKRDKFLYVQFYRTHGQGFESFDTIEMLIPLYRDEHIWKEQSLSRHIVTYANTLHVEFAIKNVAN